MGFIAYPPTNRYLGIFHEAHAVLGSGNSTGNKTDKVSFVRELKTTFSLCDLAYPENAKGTTGSDATPQQQGIC